ncbi:MAG: DUF4349 domain-containing protein [Chloroflexi bacterium]|nr:DUF4349 domain-containing protein [Chloroflexota bacterium]
MNIRIYPRYLIAVVAIFALALVGACASGSSDESSGYPGAAGAPADYDALVRMEGSDGSVVKGTYSTSSGSGMAFATAAPSVSKDDFLRDVVIPGDTVEQSGSSTGNSGSASIENEIASATDGRVIIRTADLQVTVGDVTQSMDDISNITTAAGGWIVTSVQPRNFSGTISIRVPADRFDDVIEQLSDLAVKVKSISTRSEDFTEEFTDVSARAQTLDDTLTQLRVLYERALTVEDAITIQKEITNVQSDLESLQARLNFLSQSSAFSFISVSLESVPVELVIDAGEDIAAAVGHPVTFRTKFTPPEGIEDFFVTWNFGDGSREETVNRIAPTGNGDEVITSPIIHYFDRDEDSPFIVTAELTGSGDAGLAEGKDTLVTTVSRLPVIEVFAGEYQTVEAGSKVKFYASFTRPEGVTDISYSWNFGDGSAPAEGDIGSIDDGDQVSTTHTYQNFRPNPYVVVLTVTGQTDVGEAEVKGEVLVFVRETIGVAASELDAGNTTRDAVRTLQSVGVFLAKAGLWLLILSPAWLIGGAVLFVVLKRRSAVRVFGRRTK